MKKIIAPFAVICAVLAFIMSGAALWVSLNSLDSDAFGLYSLEDHYDFSTPENAVKSELVIRQSSDVLALRALGRIQGRRFATPVVESHVIHKKADYRGQVLLFTSWKESDGDKEFQVVSVEKDPDSGLWLHSGNVFAWDIKNHSELFKQVSDWNDKESDADL